MIPLPYKLLGIVLAAVAVIAAVWGYGHRQYTQGVRATTDHYEAALSRQRAEAATTLAGETAKTLATERALQDRKTQQDTQDAKNRNTLADLQTRLHRAAAGPAMRLRDPNAAPAGCGPGSGSATGATASAAPGGAADTAQAGGLLSVQLSDLLARLLHEADDVNAVYASCRADAYTVREQSPP